MINWTKYNNVEWINISDKLIKEYKRNDAKEKEKNQKSKIIQFKKIKKEIILILIIELMLKDFGNQKLVKILIADVTEIL